MKKKTKGKTTQSSTKWLDRNANDRFSKLAKQNNFRSRAAYKLDGINQKFKILKGAKNILDLGAAPGSWLQYISRFSKVNNMVVGVDLKNIEAIENIKIIEGDFTSGEVWNKLDQMLSGNKFNLICSDMAPNTSGTRSINHINIMNLAESVFSFSENFLDKGGSLVIKLFEGNKTKEFFNKLRLHFREVHFFKPEASYKDSSEIFIIAINKI
ncbi:RlmE family RNA methyltransferase [Candidatus Bandiella numerosa]|uniref:RlmE family RNA methyltransferase n=1 Tax=Candidatus Bandiella numerosa TaxID=2570586 RepID=UPI001F15C40B|nr:RlmE family RNA methyltransferase [Candidatus Bandiella numerosa]